MFSQARTSSGHADETIIETTEKCVKAVQQKWNDLHLSLKGTKIHAVFMHLIQQMKKERGIGCFGEDFVEKLHQTGKKEERRTGNMTDRVKAAILHSRQEWATMIPEINMGRYRVKKETSKKRKSESNTSVKQKQKNRKERREDYLRKVSMEPDLMKQLLPTNLIDDNEV